MRSDLDSRNVRLTKIDAIEDHLGHEAVVDTSGSEDDGAVIEEVIGAC